MYQQPKAFPLHRETDPYVQFLYRRYGIHLLDLCIHSFTNSQFERPKYIVFLPSRRPGRVCDTDQYVVSLAELVPLCCRLELLCRLTSNYPVALAQPARHCLENPQPSGISTSVIFNQVLTHAMINHLGGIV